jgi:hypothetical protein
MDEMFSTWWDLTDQSISHPDIEYFPDGSSFVWDSTCFARYALLTLDTVIEACLLSVRTSVQKAELITLTWVLLLTAGMQVNIYMDSKYVLLGIRSSPTKWMGLSPFEILFGCLPSLVKGL